MKKALLVIASIVSVVLILGLGASLYLNVSALKRVDSLKGEISELKEKLSPADGDGEAAEDGITIAEEYRIESTLPLSDAYKSGDRSALSDKEKETLDMASAVLDEIITDGMSDYEKEEAVYLWMTKNLQSDEGILPVIPTTQADCDNPYGVLKYHNAVCVGYATTFRLFMQMMDIDCMVVHNSERFHTWDLVKIGDGWYHTDVYSDAGSGNYSHFNRTDSMVAMEQSWDTEFFPAADSYEYCYISLASKDVEDVYEFPTLLREALDSHEGVLAVRCGEEEAERDVAILGQMALLIQDKMSSSVEFSSVYMDYNCYPVDEGYVFAVNLAYSDEEDPDYTDVLDGEDYEKIDKSVGDSFGDLTENDDWDEDWETDGVWDYDGIGVTEVDP